nr:hypothetical protein [Tanacetum cinerariifolium]
MFKVFNRCLTSRPYGHDQTMIIILQIFHDVVNKVNVDYFESVPKRLEEEYHAIKDDTSLVSVYTIGKEQIGHLAPLGHLTLRMLFRINEKEKKLLKKQVRRGNLQKITIKKQKPISTSPPPPSDDQEQDSGTRLERESYKENPEIDDDDDDDDMEKKDDKKDDDENHDHDDHALLRTRRTGSLEKKNEKMLTPIPSPPRSPRIDLSSDKIIS